MQPITPGITSPHKTQDDAYQSPKARPLIRIIETSPGGTNKLRSHSESSPGSLALANDILSGGMMNDLQTINGAARVEVQKLEPLAPSRPLAPSLCRGEPPLESANALPPFSRLSFPAFKSFSWKKIRPSRSFEIGYCSINYFIY